MNDSTTSSWIVPLLCVLRCLIPLLILFGISYILRRLGLIKTSASEPKEGRTEGNHSDKGDLVHGSV
jgi:hypothetical protein